MFFFRPEKPALRFFCGVYIAFCRRSSYLARLLSHVPGVVCNARQSLLFCTRYLHSLMWGAGAAIPSDRLKEMRARVILLVLSSGCCSLGLPVAAGAQRAIQDRPDRRARTASPAPGPARPSRPARPARAARRAGTAQPKLARHSQTMPGRILRGVLQRQRSSGRAPIAGRGEIRRHFSANAGITCGIDATAANTPLVAICVATPQQSNGINASRARRRARRKRPRRLSAPIRDETMSPASGAETER